METKFKVGDKVLLTKPKEKDRDTIAWTPYLDVYNGKEFIVKQIYLDDNTYLCEFKDSVVYWFCESWLTKVGELPTEQVTEQATEQVTEQVTNPIDWEQRRWDLYKMLLMHYSQHSIGEALNVADRCIESYKQKLK